MCFVVEEFFTLKGFGTHCTGQRHQLTVVLDVVPELLCVLKLFGAQQACSVEHALFLNMCVQVHYGILFGIFGFLLIFIFAAFLSFFFLFRQLTRMWLLYHL